MNQLTNPGVTMSSRTRSFLFLIFILSTTISFAQNGQSLIKNGAPTIYIDCGFCDMDYIKEQMPIVNYVRDRKDADVHVLSTSQMTAAGGYDYTLYFIGQNKFANLNDTIKYTTNQTDTGDLTRAKLVKALKMGIVRYVARTNVSDQMNISFEKPEQRKEEQKDDWDFWYFRLSTSGNFNGEKNYKYLYLYSSLSASRVTEDLKINFSISNNYNQNKYTIVLPDTSYDVLNITRNQYANASLIKAIDSNWSWGIWLGANSSTYSNIEFSAYVSPGIEYNIFPYSVSNERQLRIDYKITHSFTNYSEETIYFKTRENLWSQNLSANLSLIRPWGSMSISAEGGNYLHDLKMYELGMNGSISLNLFKGLSLNFYGGYSKIANQVSLRREGATLEDVLTQRRQLETNYNFWGGFGISYSFGSIYNNIVNPRFGGTGGSTMIISM